MYMNEAFKKKEVLSGTLMSEEAQEAEIRLLKDEHEEIDEECKKTENKGQIGSLTVISDEQKIEDFFLACYELGRAAGDALRKMGEILRDVYENMYLAEPEKRKRQLWRKYYLRKGEMSNNERRRRRLAMVRRPKKQEYMIKREKKLHGGHRKE